MDATDLIGLGDHPALDFLNSTAEQGGMVIEGLGDGPSLLAWLRHAELISPEDAETAGQKFARSALDEVAAETVELREWLRPVIAAWASNDTQPVPAEVRDRLNSILHGDRAYAQIRLGESGVTEVRYYRHWHDPRQLLVPAAAAAADLLAYGDPSLVRHCEGLDCTMWFYDRTKAHRRRWCSMALCGNRAKARAHRSRNAGTN